MFLGCLGSKQSIWKWKSRVPIYNNFVVLDSVRQFALRPLILFRSHSWSLSNLACTLCNHFWELKFFKISLESIILSILTYALLQVYARSSTQQSLEYIFFNYNNFCNLNLIWTDIINFNCTTSTFYFSQSSQLQNTTTIGQLVTTSINQ